MSSGRLALAAPAALLLPLLLASSGCSSKGHTQFGSTGDDGGAEGGDDGSPGSSGGSGSSSGGISLGDGGTSGGGGMGTGTCKDGTYSGTFQCTFVFGDGGTSGGGADSGTLAVTGTISFHLMQNAASGESFMSTASGMFSGDCCNKLFTIGATVGGTLNCNSGTFNGSLTDGGYSGFIFLTGSFSGPLTADYNGMTFSFVNGVWNLTVPGQGTCPGTWTASYTGP
jgi:hypothetical protein